MATEPEAPLVPPDVDLRGMEFMPLKGDILFKSTTWLKGSHEARCAALRLWWHAFAHEVPAASLPDDDFLLAEHAGYGEVVKAWLKIKPQALRGWVLCSDGRWYHKTVAALALEAWDGRLKNREKMRKWREKKASRDTDGNGGGNGNSGGSVPVTGQGDEPVTGVVTNRRELKGQLQGESQLQGEGEIIIDSEAASPPVAARAPAVTATSPEDAAFADWQRIAAIEGWPPADFLNSTRRYRLQAILAICGGLNGWNAAIDRARDAEFLRKPDGAPQRWFDLDWLLDEQKFTRLMEGRYAERHDHRSTDLERARAGIDQAATGGSVPDGGGADAYLDRPH